MLDIIVPVSPRTSGCPEKPGAAQLFVWVFDGAADVRENIAGDVLASGTTIQWNSPAKGWNARASMDDANFNRRKTIQVGASAAYMVLEVIGFSRRIWVDALQGIGGRPPISTDRKSGRTRQPAAPKCRYRADRFLF